jgi:glyceraldehyde 3-phosphate dehydrogenase
MTVKVGINGFGRIGRNFVRALIATGADIEVVAVNDPGLPPALMVHLLKYDTVLGRLPVPVAEGDGGITVDGKAIRVHAERAPKDIPWGDLGVDMVLEASGFFAERDTAAYHLDGGAPMVIVTAPAKGADATFVYGVNHTDFNRDEHKVVSNASCTTNCFVPMVKVLDDAFGIEKGLMTTIHAYTGTQALVDGPSKDLREARAAAVNIIPSSTGAARATSLVLPEMAGKLDGQALRVPVPDGSFTDFTVILGREVTVEEINAAYRTAAESGPLSSVLVYSEDPIVSSDIVGSPASCTFDAPLTMANGSLVKVGGWYDNEWGYSNRLVDLVAYVGSK